MPRRAKRSVRTREIPVTYAWLALERAERFLMRGAELEPQIGKEQVRRQCEDCLAAAIVFGDSALEQLGAGLGKDVKNELGHRRPLIDFMTRVRNSEMHFAVAGFPPTLNAQHPMRIKVTVPSEASDSDKVRLLWLMGPDGAVDERDWLRIQPSQADRQVACFAQYRAKQWEAITKARAVRLISAYLRVIRCEIARCDPAYNDRT